LASDRPGEAGRLDSRDRQWRCAHSRRRSRDPRRLGCRWGDDRARRLRGAIAAFLRTSKDPGAPSLPEQQAIVLEHYDAMLEHYGSAVGSRVARKHLGWYLDQSEASVELRKARRKRLCQEEQPARVRALLAETYAELQEHMH
jgi:tRNA-dihydrouridine synthase